MNKPRLAKPLNAQIRAEATEWLIRFSESEADASMRGEFNEWLRTSPEHVRGYLRVSAFWQEAHRISGQNVREDIEALVQLAHKEGNIVPLELDAGERAPQRRKIVRGVWASAAAILLAVGIGVATWYGQHRGPVYSTGIGEQRTINLPDGSIVLINARSRIKVNFTGAERGIDLREGQALFKVAHNRARPFIVRSGGASVRAVGTQFDVYRKKSGTVVTVVEGRVSVSKPSRSTFAGAEHASETELHAGVLVSAGEQAVITARSARRNRMPHPEAATAWTEGLLVFEGAPLSEVVHEFNRQNTRRLVLANADLAGLRISGTFPASGAERIVRFLQERFDVVVTESDDEIRIARR